VANVFSKQLVNLPAVSGGPFSAYTVPAGFVTVIKTLQIVYGDVVVSGLDAWFETSEGTKLTRIRLASLPGPPNIGGDNLRYGHFALNPGESLFVQAEVGTADFFASGYELTLP